MKSLNALGAVVLFTGSVATVPALAAETDSGWRLGRVVEVGDAGAIAHDQRARCADRMTAASGTYARVSYSGDPRFQRRVIAAVPAGTDVKVGERVYVNVDRCDAELETRSTHADRNPR
jgi:hypothetical protein